MFNCKTGFIIFCFLINAHDVAAQITITEDEERKIKAIVEMELNNGKATGELLDDSKTTSSARGLESKKNAPPENYFRDRVVKIRDYSPQLRLEKNSNTVSEVTLSKTSKLVVTTCYDNELILTIHPDYYNHTSILQEKLSRGDNFEFLPIVDLSRTGQSIKGGTIRTKIANIPQEAIVETQLSLQMSDSYEWYNITVQAVACGDRDDNLLKVIYIRPYRQAINEKSHILSPQDKFIEITWPYKEVDIQKDFNASIGDMIATSDASWIIVPLYIYLQYELEGDSSDREFILEASVLHSNKIDEIKTKIVPLQTQTEALSITRGQQIARFNLNINVDYRYAVSNKYVYLFVKDKKRKKFQLLKLDIEEFFNKLKKEKVAF